MEVGKVEGFDLLLVDEDDVHSLLELVNHAHLQVAVEGNQGLAVPAPSWMHIDYQQFGVLVVEVRQEVVSVADHGCQLHLLCYLCHLI